jgi:catecholate siderophore receptor
MPDFSVPFRATGGTPARTAASSARVLGLNNRDYRRGQTDTGEIRVEHRLDENWKLRNTTMFGRSTLDYVATNPQFLSSNPNILQLQAKSGKYATNSVANQTEDRQGHAVWHGTQSDRRDGIQLGTQHVRGLPRERQRRQQYPLGRPCTVAYNCTPIGGWDSNAPWTGSIVLNGDKGFPGAPTTRIPTWHRPICSTASSSASAGCSMPARASTASMSRPRRLARQT